MGKVQIQQIDKKTRYEMIGDFYDIVTRLKDKKDVIGFFMGLLTPSEALMFARRIQIAQMLLDGKSYDDIRSKLKVGGATVTSVARWLYGENEQFRTHVGKHMAYKKKMKKEKYKPKDYYTSVLNRYPGHRLLKDILGMW